MTIKNLFQDSKFYLSCLSFLGVAGVAAPAFAVPEALKCTDTRTVNCVKNDVLIVEGTPDLLATTGPVINRGCREVKLQNEGIDRWSCYFDREKVAQKVLKLLKDGGAQNQKWDQAVLFYADAEEPSVFGGTREKMLFYREGGTGPGGVSDVGGIGIEKKPRVAGVPWVGYITGGSTTAFGSWFPRRDRALPDTLRWWPLPDPEGVPGFEVRYRGCDGSSLCTDGFNAYQVLAQATSQMFGPFIREELQLQGDNWFHYSQEQRSQCSPQDTAAVMKVPPSYAGVTLPDGGAGDASPAPTTVNPRSDFDAGGRPLLDLNQSSGTRVKDSNTSRLGVGEPALTVCPDQKANLATSVQPPAYNYDRTTGRPQAGAITAGGAYGVLRPRIWNSFIDLDGSLMGSGANWFENGNGTASNGGASAFQSASPPYLGRRMSVFHPLELWLMGFLPKGEVSLKVYETKAADMIGPQAVLGRYTQNAGPRMGIPIDGATSTGAQRIQIYSDGRGVSRSIDELLEAGGGAKVDRTPAFEQAPHHIKQLWVLVTKPEDKKFDKEIINAEHIEHTLRWRRAWQQYFYMLTSYTGRMVTTFDGTTDDSPYWEFMQKDDDKNTFKPSGGLNFAVSGPRRDINSPAILSYANISTPGDDGALEFTPHAQQLPTVIDGRLVQKPRSDKYQETIDNFVVYGDNAVMVRMALPLRDPKTAPKAFATIRLKNGPDIRIPADNPGVKAAQRPHLVWDGKFHTYAVDLRKVEGYADKTYDGFTFIPSSAPVECDTTIPADANVPDDADCIKLDYIRFTNVPNPDDANDIDRGCDGSLMPDGFIGAEDNCPNLFNPEQSDANGDGVGDACEDADFDAIVNGCDNCPTLTNARQSNNDGDELGDACDDSYRGGCFMQPDAVAGNGAGGASIPLMLLGLSLAGIFGFRLSRRNRRK